MNTALNPTSATYPQQGFAHHEATGTAISSRIDSIGRRALPAGLASVIAWVGAMKFTAYEAEGITGLVQNHPLMSWVYNVMSVRAFGTTLGVIEVGIALAIVLGFIMPRVGALGAALAIGMFATTLSFIVTTPGVFEPSLGGFPALSIMPGQFLIKDIVLLAASIWLLGDSLKRAA